MTRILLVRHGESEANLARCFAGQIDPELTELGMEQARLTAKFILDNYKVDKVYASDLQRAYKTAKALGDMLGLEVIKTRGMREIDGGEWEGIKWDDLVANYPVEYGIWMNDIGNSSCPAGETMRDFSNRIMTELERIAKENDGKTVAIGTHATPIRVIQGIIERGDVSKISDVPWASNASVTVIEYDGEFKLIAASLDKHLGELITTLE